MHPRVSVDNHMFGTGSVRDHAILWDRCGSKHVGLAVPLLTGGLDELEQVVPFLREKAYSFATIMYPFLFGRAIDQRAAWSQAQAEVNRVLAAAHTLDAESVYMLTGARGAFDWEDAAAALGEAIAPCVAEARRLEIPLLIETATALYADVHMAHSLADTVRLAESADLGICIDIFASWAESGLRDSIRRAVPRCALVQVGDWIPGDRSQPCRAVPGDGIIPLERIIGWILEEGYTGSFDLEIHGARTFAEGGVEASIRAADRLGEMLLRMGA